jgi:hypothetical protein
MFYAYVSGIVVLAVLWVLCGVLCGAWNPWKLVIGADGRPSTSKLQWFLWTVVIIFSYAAIYAARAGKGNFEAISDMPANLLIAMGLSITTMAAAKGITVSYVTSGRVVKTATASEDNGPAPIIQDDDGFPDLSKIQMMAWTIIAVGIYLISVAHQIGTDLPKLPDIEPSLMVLMGLGQGAYLGKKLTTTTVPRLTGLSPGSGKPGTTVTVAGLSLGDKQDGSLLTIDGNPFQPDSPPVWQDTQISFTIPPKHPGGREWSEGQRVLVGLIVNGQESANTLPFTVMH